MDQDYSATVEIWVHTVSDRRIGIFYGHLIQGIDMKIPSSIKSIDGEARLYMVVSGGYDVLVFEAYGTVHPPHALSKYFAPFQKEIKRWKVGTFPNFTDVPDNSGVHTLSNDASVDTSFSVE